jgi:hypothetical protein
MTQTAAGEMDAFAQIRTRNELARTVRAALKGSGLDIRERATKLAISNPGHPENGRIYIKFVTAEVSHQRTEWDYLGHLDGHGSSDPDGEPPVDTERIIAALGGHLSTHS